jgi:general secretion pathway protein D
MNEDDPEVADDEMVSRVIQMNTMSAPQIVPILRPLLPQYAHLAALPEQNVLLIVDRYANVKRLTEIVLALDK